MDFLPQTEKRRPSIFAANTLFLLAAIGLMLTPFAVDPLIQLIRQRFPSTKVETLLLLASVCYYIPFLLVPALFYARRHIVWEAMRLEQPLAPSVAILASLAAILALPLGTDISALWSLALQKIGLALPESATHIPSTSSGLVLAVFYLGVLPGFCEEIAFRGFILSAWERRGRLRALLVSSVLFAALHGSIAGFPTQLLLGGIIGLIAVYSGTVYAGMIFHTLYNSLILISQYYVQNLLPSSPELEEAARLAGSDIFAYLGGGMGLLHLFLEMLLLAGLLYLLLRGVRRRGALPAAQAESGDARGMSIQELMVLIAGIVTVLYLYGRDFLDMLGGIR